MNFTLKTCAERESEWVILFSIFESHDFNPFRCILWISARFECIKLFLYEIFPRGISTAANSSWWNLINYKSLTLNQCSTCRYINIEARIKANDIENDLHNLKEFHDRLSTMLWMERIFFYILNTMTDVIVLCVYFHMTKMMNKKCCCCC